MAQVKDFVFGALALLIVAGSIGAVCVLACKPAAAPLTADQVAGELEDAGCLAPGSSDAVAAELATGHDAWLNCLQEGGTIQGCNAPCEHAGWVRRPTTDP
jgi:hypothetical protein